MNKEFPISVSHSKAKQYATNMLLSTPALTILQILHTPNPFQEVTRQETVLIYPLIAIAQEIPARYARLWS